MRMDRIEPEPDRSGAIAVRLLRRWVAAREAGRPALPDLVRFGIGLGVSPELAVALASVFQLTEASLGRPLQAQCCCSRDLGGDEHALLLLLAAAIGPTAPRASRTIPHGLPGALRWAVLSVRRLLELDERVTGLVITGCPFRRDG